MTEQRKRVPRRVRTEPVPGSDPTPQTSPGPGTPVHASEDTDSAWGDRGAGGVGSHGANAGENDEQLRRDVPPHW